MVTPIITSPQEQPKFISADEFFKLGNQPEYADIPMDLIEGVVHIMSIPGGEHGEITMEFARLIGNFVKTNKLGRVTAAETGYILFKNPDGPDTVLGPDIGFVSYARHPEKLPKKHIPVPPDLAVEVVSSGNTATEIHNKVRLYLKAGTRLVWVVYPDAQEIVMHTSGGATTLTVDDNLNGGDVLPGFTLAVKDIFEV